MKHICEKCGAELDKNTGLCPNCDGDEFVPMENLEELEEKKVTKRGIIAIFAGIILILVVASVAIIAVLNGWIGGSEKRSAAYDSYKTYFNETLYPNYGVLDTKHPYVDGTGMFFADLIDLSGDKSENLVVGSAMQSGDKIDYNISCYEYNPNNTAVATQGNAKSTGVELDTTIDIFDENDFVSKSSERAENKFEFYLVEHKDRSYIFFERVSGNKWYCKVYTVDKGAFAEVESISIENYKDGQKEVKEFFKDYGVKKVNITDKSGDFILSKKDKDDMLFSYSYVPDEKSENVESDYNVIDYTDMLSFLTNENKAAVESESEKNDKSSKKKTTSKAEANFGEVVKNGSDIYYWKYNSRSFSDEKNDDGEYRIRSGAQNQLVKRDGSGEESVILESAGAGKLALAGGRLFFQKANGNSGSYNVDSCDLNGNDLKYHDTGVIEGVVQNGDYIVYSTQRTKYDFKTIKAIRVQDLEEVTTAYNARFVACDGQRVYYQSEQAERREARHGKTTLAGVYANGSASRTLYVTDSDLYENEDSSKNTASIIRGAYILNDCIYYAYGSYDEESDAFKGGNVVKAKLDGSGGEIIAQTGSDTFALDSANKLVAGASAVGYSYNDGDVYKFNVQNGKNEKIIDSDDYSSFASAKAGDDTAEESVKLVYAVKVDDKLYFMMTKEKKSGEESEFDGCALFVKDTKENTTSLIYSSDAQSETEESGYESEDQN